VAQRTNFRGWARAPRSRTRVRIADGLTFLVVLAFAACSTEPLPCHDLSLGDTVVLEVEGIPQPRDVAAQCDASEFGFTQGLVIRMTAREALRLGGGPPHCKPVTADFDAETGWTYSWSRTTSNTFGVVVDAHRGDCRGELAGGFRLPGVSDAAFTGPIGEDPRSIEFTYTYAPEEDQGMGCPATCSGVLRGTIRRERAE
jgi:hypothetical protein